MLPLDLHLFYCKLEARNKGHQPTHPVVYLDFSQLPPHYSSIKRARAIRLPPDLKRLQGPLDYETVPSFSHL